MTIVADKKISPKAPAAKDKKESGKTEAATRVSRVKRVNCCSSRGSSRAARRSGARALMVRRNLVWLVLWALD